ncbi:hypothetical protein ACN47E_002199 [Coniothyrium glycines]
MEPEKTLSLDLSKYPKLDVLQAGHIRHYHNLSSQLDGDWNHMAGLESHQEIFDAFRYQISSMAYGAGAAHFHRLPAARSTFKKLLDQLIHKMLLRDVWNYWFTASMSGNYVDPGLTELRTPWANPIIRENIMYSGHLHLMTSLYAMLFDDDKFEKPKSLTLTWDPVLWGLGKEVWHYDNRSIQAIILKEWEESKWVGVCCEPNLVFIVCNQFPLIAMRYNDVRDGTTVADEVVAKYKATWEKRGMVTPSGLYPDWVYYKQDKPAGPSCICFTAWANAFMTTWNCEVVESLFERQKLGFMTSLGGEWRVHDFEFAKHYRAIIERENVDFSMISEEKHSAIIDEAEEMRRLNPEPEQKYVDPVFGCVLQWLSELGKQTELQGLLAWADKHLQPTWENGGLFYPRKDSPLNRGSVWRHMDPFTGNGGIAYSRLNVYHGQKKMWDAPWTKETIAKRPWIDNIDLSQGIDTIRAIWDAEEQALVLTVRTWDITTITAEPVATNLDFGLWAVYLDGALTKQETVEERGSIKVMIQVGRNDVDVVFKHISGVHQP